MKQTQRKIITIEKPLRELKRSSHDIDDEETINILKNYYIPNQERNNIDYMISLLNKKTSFN